MLRQAHLIILAFTCASLDLLLYSFRLVRPITSLRITLSTSTKRLKSLFKPLTAFSQFQVTFYAIRLTKL